MDGLSLKSLNMTLAPMSKYTFFLFKNRSTTWWNWFSSVTEVRDLNTGNQRDTAPILKPGAYLNDVGLYAVDPYLCANQQQPENVPQQPGNVSKQPGNISKQPVNVSELSEKGSQQTGKGSQMLHKYFWSWTKRLLFYWA